MAWSEVKQTVSFRKEILRLAAQPGANIRELCRRFQVSPKTFYKWLKRLRTEGEAGLRNRSRRPHQSPRRTETAIESKIVSVRTEHPSWGARKIRRVLVNRHQLDVPTNSTVHRILQRNGKIDPAAKSLDGKGTARRLRAVGSGERT